jgi:tRNA nucleotidyltransferase/poly(A) polymerase
VLLVGGAVRDLLLQRGEPKDYDILTSAQLKQVRSTLVNLGFSRATACLVLVWL